MGRDVTRGTETLPECCNGGGLCWRKRKRAWKMRSIPPRCSWLRDEVLFGRPTLQWTQSGDSCRREGTTLAMHMPRPKCIPSSWSLSPW
ncbi:hypothetical protein E2C01_056976 [Portunus trituberculatus]|uniref:Uncharacterized protein n=1 Tax=Portunus trituberculatus TaxID=210409 RepID=A0A5B7GZ43_PORTR|nr:hypothetical protein [Portunus trituberculatus]